MADAAQTREKGLEERLEELLEQERFPPPEEFAREALLRDPADLRARPPRTLLGLVGRAGRDLLDWSEELTRAARLVRPAVRQVVRRRQAQRLLQLPRPPRARPATATASPSTGAARRARSRTITYADLHRDVQRFANALKDNGDREGRRRRDLPADGARGRRRDARLRAHRRAPQRRLRRLLAPSRCKERMEFSEAKVLITVDGARRKGKTAPIKQQVDEVMGDLDRSSDLRGQAHAATTCADGGRARRLVPRGARAGRRRVPGRADRRRAPAVHPLHVAARRPSRRASCTPPAAT